jgi:putative transcriptional regulator
MIRLLLAERLADKAFREKRRVEWKEVSEATGIHRTTLSKMLNTPGYNATLENLERLCLFFQCQVGELAVHVADEPDEIGKTVG